MAFIDINLFTPRPELFQLTELENRNATRSVWEVISVERMTSPNPRTTTSNSGPKESIPLKPVFAWYAPLLPCFPLYGVHTEFREDFSTSRFLPINGVSQKYFGVSPSATFVAR